MRRTLMAVLTVVLVAVTVSVATPAGAHEESGDGVATFSVTFENLTGGQYFTPPNWAAHDDDVEIFEKGEEASFELQNLAENGDVPGLAAALAASIDGAGLGVSGVGAAAPIPPGGSASWTFTTSEEDFSIASMLICTNDGFAGLDSKRLPRRDGQTKTYNLKAYDAGTEINTELDVDIVPAPFCLGDEFGTGMSNPALAEDEEIRRHRGIRGVGDFGPEFNWHGPVARVTVTRMDPVPEYSIAITNISEGQFLTPPNIAIHDRSADVFSKGHAASAGVQAVAENGGVPVLATEIAANIDSMGLGASTVAGDVHISPGETRVVDLASRGRRLSVVAMVICTNDGFAGLDSKKLRLDSGESKTFYVRAYDAGTEINTELHADLVPAPFCGGMGAGTGMSNPALAEGGVITRHHGIQGVGDLGPSFDWDGPVAMVTITRTN